MLIKCPWCGERSLAEFSYQGDATVERPADPAALDDGQWNEFLNLRDNPMGWHDEIWHHMNGCRKHFKARRNVVTHEIADTKPMDGSLTGGGK